MALEVQTAINLVGNNPNSALAGEVQEDFQGCSARNPAGRVCWCREYDRTGSCVACGLDTIEIQPPVAIDERQGHRTRFTARKMDQIVNVRPLRLEVDDILAEVDDELESEKQRL